MDKFINFVLKNKKMVLCASTTVVVLIAIIIGASLLMKGDNETITEPSILSYSTTIPTSTIPPIEVNKTESAEPENTSSIEPGETSGGLEVTVQGGTTPPSGSNNNSVKSPAATKSPSLAATSSTTKPAAPTASAQKPTTSISIVTNSTKSSTTTQKPTPTPTTTIYTNKNFEDVDEIISVAVNVMSLWDTVDYRTIGEAWKKDVLYYYAAFTTSTIPSQLDNIITNAKKYNIVSVAEFVPDSKTSIQNSETDFIIRGTFYIKYSSLTNADYLKQIGFKADTWYSKRVDVYIVYPASQHVWEHGNYCAKKQVDLTDWKVTTR